MFFFNPELLLISGIDASNPNDPIGWVWITNPIDIAIFYNCIYRNDCLFMCNNGLFLTKTNILENFICSYCSIYVLTKIMESKLGLGDHHVSYLIGIGFLLLYLMQKAKIKKN